MEKNSHFFVVGLFVSISLLALTLFVIWLAGTHDMRHYQRYTIYFHDPVSGLKESAVVQYRGVDVGNVMDVRLAPRNNNLIKVDIEVDDTTPVFQSTQALLAMQGITGVIYIDLSTKEGDTTPPLRVEGEEYPVIAGRGTQLGKLFQDVPEISKKVLELTNKLNTAFNDENVAALGQTLQNVETVSANLNSLLSQENITNTTTALRNISASSENLDELVTRFTHTADEMDKAVSTLNSILSENRGDINKFAGSGLNQITEMSRETKEMAESIRRLADKLEADPSRLLYQPKYRGVEIKK